MRPFLRSVTRRRNGLRIELLESRRLLHGDAVVVAKVSAMDHDVETHSHAHSDHVAASSESPPSLTMRATETEDGLQIFFDLSHFQLSEDNVNGDHVDGEGHLHLYIDGEKISRVFSASHQLESLTPGNHIISADLNSNDHRAYAIEGEKIEATFRVYSDDFVGPIDASALRLSGSGNSFASLAGVDAGDASGAAIHSAGDFNGDGIDDVVVAAANADNGGNANDGEVYVVYGSSAGLPSSFDLSTLNGVNGFRLIGENTGDLAGTSVGGGHDVNGDGLDDLVIGAPGADANSQMNAGAAYVVFGADDFGASFNLANLNGSNGFRVTGASAGDDLGRSVAITGDMNNDNYADVILGAPLHDSGGEDAGAGYVIYGSAGPIPSSLDLSMLTAAQGIRIDGGKPGENLGYSVEAAGDLNGDQDGDVVFGAPTGFGTGVATSCDASNTVGLIQCDADAAPGYTLFSPNPSTEAFLVDQNGFLVNSWSTSDRPGLSAQLLDDGSLLRTANTRGQNFVAGGNGGAVEIYDWDGNLTWQYSYSNANHRLHHDVEILPNGNVLMIAWELKTQAEAIAAGRDPSQLDDGRLWPDHIIEVEQTGATTGDIVWQWNAWDHLVQEFDPTKDNFGVVADNPQLIDINFMRNGGEDWLHINSIDYNPDLDQILLSVHGFSEIWVIDHSTTTAEAASHSGGNSGRGGDLLYRWGNPQAYDRGGAADRVFFTQHDAQWVEPGLPGAGNLLIFNNGQQRPGGNASSVDEITPPVDVNGAYTLVGNDAYGPSNLAWTWTDSPATAFYAQNISGAHRLPNGNTLITDGPSGRFLEVDPMGNEVFEYINPVRNNGPVAQGTNVTQNAVFRATKYDPSFAGFSGKDLSPGGTVETGGGSTSMIAVEEGAAYVLFGSDSLANLNVQSLSGSNGFKVSGVEPGDQLGYAVSSAGDVNDDGFSDLIVGSPRAKVDGVSIGAAYVIHGKATGYDAELFVAALDGTSGYRLAGDYESDPILNSLFVNANGATGYNGAVVNFDSVIPDQDHVHIHTSGIPHYTTIGPWAANPNDATDQDVTFYIPRNPEINTGDKSVTRLGAIGTWVDGTAIFNWSDGRSYQNQGNWNQLANIFEAVSFDSCGAHPPGTGQYHTHGGPACLINELNDDGSSHSPILGWSFDGFPIYGEYGYVNGDPNAGIKRMESSWQLRNLTTRANGPTLNQQALGSYLEDYQYLAGSGDLDEYNGQFAPTPEYPDGIYHYRVTFDSVGEPAFPYVIGLEYAGVVGPGNANNGGAAPDLDDATISVGNVGDHNNDGFDDVIVGDPDSHTSGVGTSGSAVVVFGHGNAAVSDTHLHTIDDSTGIHLHGSEMGDQLGTHVGNAGDVNSDGGDDAVIGAPGSDFSGSDAGETFLLFGEGTLGDYGDAPESYATTLSVNGARHLATGPRLGDLRDAELDGQASPMADGDGSDEDGVLFGTITLGQTMAGVNIELQNASEARVDAWIDFAGDGAWDAADQILDSALLQSGLQTLNITLPATAVAGETFARVRVSTAGNLDWTGASEDGEVEDYLVTIHSNAPQVEEVQVNGGDAQRSLLTEVVVTFDSDVNAPASAFSIVNRASTAAVENLIVSSSLIEGRTVSVLTFGIGDQVDSRDNGVHSLSDGGFQLEIDRTQVLPTGGGIGMEEDFVFGDEAADQFFRFFGDTDGDRDVDGQDYGRFGLTFLKGLGEQGFDDRLDRDGDGDVDGQDYGRFGLRFLQSLRF